MESKPKYVVGEYKYEITPEVTATDLRFVFNLEEDRITHIQYLNGSKWEKPAKEVISDVQQAVRHTIGLHVSKNTENPYGPNELPTWTLQPGAAVPPPADEALAKRAMQEIEAALTHHPKLHP